MNTELIEQELNTDIVEIDSDISARLTALREKSSDSITLWDPEPNETLAGVLISSREATGAYGPQQQLILQDEQGLHAVWLSDFIKKTLLAKNAEKGSLVCITFLGNKHTANGKSYRAFDIRVDNNDMGVNL
ncbi:MAG: hypothetical protein HOK14_05795 [Gammaproteobacteria bacterium]|nr:hypothetical protein [Gammaproteobacteria bacterium]MBT6419833.1 hypothetical protein [Gammaproteobacteria bacterium]